MQIVFSGYARGGFQKSPSAPTAILLAVGSTDTRYPPEPSGMASQFSSPRADQGGGTRLTDVYFPLPLEATNRTAYPSRTRVAA
nr:hypothetical protein [uncultured Methanospirillum sp.]